MVQGLVRVGNTSWINAGVCVFDHKMSDLDLQDTSSERLHHLLCKDGSMMRVQSSREMWSWWWSVLTHWFPKQIQEPPEDFHNTLKE